LDEFLGSNDCPKEEVGLVIHCLPMNQSISDLSKADAQSAHVAPHFYSSYNHTSFRTVQTSQTLLFHHCQPSVVLNHLNNGKALSLYSCLCAANPMQISTRMPIHQSIHTQPKPLIETTPQIKIHTSQPFLEANARCNVCRNE